MFVTSVHMFSVFRFEVKVGLKGPGSAYFGWVGDDDLRVMGRRGRGRGFLDRYIYLVGGGGRHWLWDEMASGCVYHG